jgi:hypothetical protein
MKSGGLKMGGKEKGVLGGTVALLLLLSILQRQLR